MRSSRRLEPSSLAASQVKLTGPLCFTERDCERNAETRTSLMRKELGREWMVDSLLSFTAGLIHFGGPPPCFSQWWHVPFGAFFVGY